MTEVYLMTLSRYHLVLIGFTVIIMGSTLLLTDQKKIEYRDPSDVVWMERVRQNALDQLEPIRNRINVVESQTPGILVGGSPSDAPAIVALPRADRIFVIQIIDAARESVIETIEWDRDEPESRLPSPPQATRLFELKDHLWDLTLLYLALLRSVYSRDREVLSSEITTVEFQLMMFSQLLQMELDRLGLNEED